MKLIGRTLAILAAALVVAGIVFAIGSLGASTSTGVANGMEMGHGMQGGFNLGGIIQILPTLAVVGIITAIVAPIKRRLESKRRPSKLNARRPLPTTATPSI